MNADRVLLSGVNMDNGFLTLDLLPAVMPEVPEPATYALMALGLAGLGFAARRCSSGAS